MLRHLATLALILTFASASASAAWSPEGYPGSTWGNIGRDLSAFEGNDTMGKVTQGVHWVTLPGKIPFETYGSYRWRYRTENNRFFDAQGPAAGFSLQKGPFSTGIDLAWKSYPQLDRKNRTFVYYFDWYKSVDFLKVIDAPPPALLPAMQLPIASWGSLQHDLDSIEGDIVMGWVKIGISPHPLPYKAKATAYGRYRVRTRTKNNQYFNASGPSVGFELKRAPLTLSVEYAWTTFEILRRETNDVRLEANWYIPWDLKDLASLAGKK
jgi:hypothetical protein